MQPKKIWFTVREGVKNSLAIWCVITCYGILTDGLLRALGIEWGQPPGPMDSLFIVTGFPFLACRAFEVKGFWFYIYKFLVNGNTRFLRYAPAFALAYLHDSWGLICWALMGIVWQSEYCKDRYGHDIFVMATMIWTACIAGLGYYLVKYSAQEIAIPENPGFFMWFGLCFLYMAKPLLLNSFYLCLPLAAYALMLFNKAIYASPGHWVLGFGLLVLAATARQNEDTGVQQCKSVK